MLGKYSLAFWKCWFLAKLLSPMELIPVFSTLIIQQGALGLRSELLSLAQTFMPVFLSPRLGTALKVVAIALTSNDEKPSVGAENTFIL